MKAGGGVRQNRPRGAGYPIRTTDRHRWENAVLEQTMNTTIQRLHRLTHLVLSAGALAVLAGCASATPIGELLDNASKYNGKTVRIQGEVKESAGAFGLGAYQVRDATGTIPVLSQQASPPRTGSKIGVTGKFEALVTVGSKSLAVLREESRTVP